MMKHLENVLYSLQATKEVFSLAENGNKPRGVSVNHDVKDKLLPLDTDSFELVRD